jgi:hypothetical protein
MGLVLLQQCVSAHRRKLDGTRMSAFRSFPERARALTARNLARSSAVQNRYASFAALQCIVSMADFRRNMALIFNP